MKILSVTNFMMFMSLLFTINSAEAAKSKPPYLGVSNSTKEWTATVTYITESHQQGDLVVEPNTATGITTFDEGEKASITGFMFKNKSGAVLPFKDWCPNISYKKLYNWIDVQVKQLPNNEIDVQCNSSE